MTVRVKLPKNDSMRFRFQVRLETGALLNLSGYAVTVIVKASEDATTSVYSGTGEVQPVATSAICIIPKDIMTSVGVFYGSVNATKGDESYTEAFEIQVTNHA